VDSASAGPGWSIGNQPSAILPARCSIGEVLPERLVLDLVPTEANAESVLALREQVDLGDLLGDQYCQRWGRIRIEVTSSNDVSAAR
jgi:hypothetical protein